MKYQQLYNLCCLVSFVMATIQSCYQILCITPYLRTPLCVDPSAEQVLS